MKNGGGIYAWMARCMFMIVNMQVRKHYENNKGRKGSAPKKAQALSTHLFFTGSSEKTQDHATQDTRWENERAMRPFMPYMVQTQKSYL